MGLQGHTAFKYVTGRQLDTSSGRGWTNVLAERWDHEAGELPSLVPRETEVAVLLSGRSLVYREGAGLRQRTPGRSGTVWLCPAGVREELIDFEQPLHDCLHIFLPPTRLPTARCRTSASTPHVPVCVTRRSAMILSSSRLPSRSTANWVQRHPRDGSWSSRSDGRFRRASSAAIPKSRCDRRRWRRIRP